MCGPGLAAYWPEVRQVVLDIAEVIPVVLRVFTGQCRTVAAVQPLVTEPRWQPPRRGELQLRPRCRQAGRDQVSADACRAGVGMSPANPFRADFHRIGGQCLLVASPHSHRRVMLPTVVLSRERSQDLQGLDALLTESAAVKHPRAGREVWIRQEGLHNTSRCPALR